MATAKYLKHEENGVSGNIHSLVKTKKINVSIRTILTGSEM